jgi:hypothetical protein
LVNKSRSSSAHAACCFIVTSTGAGWQLGVQQVTNNGPATPAISHLLAGMVLQLLLQAVAPAHAPLTADAADADADAGGAIELAAVAAAAGAGAEHASVAAAAAAVSLPKGP